MAVIDSDSLKTGRYALAPEILLTEKGPRRDLVLVVDRGRVEKIVPVSEYGSDGSFPPPQVMPSRAIIPGFIDTHLHLGQTFGKALVGGEPAQIWRRIWAPMEEALDPIGYYVSSKWMFLEVMRGGYTTVVNYALNDAAENAAIHAAAEETGIRLVSAAGLDEVTIGTDGRETRSSLSAILERAEELIAQCGNAERIYPSVCCSSFHSNALETLAALSEFCASRGVLFQMHSNEHFPEVHDCVLKFGKRPIELFAEIGALGPSTLLHHVTLPSETEVELLRASRTAISYNPVASQWKGNGVAPALSYSARGVRMGIGSDNTRADGFRALDAAESCQRVAHGMPVIDFSCGAAWVWVDAATRGAADACGQAGKFGALAEGQAADFLILDMKRPETLPSWDFEWELVRYYNRDQIDAVVIDGRLTMLRGRPVGWDDTAFIEENQSLATQIGSAPGIVRVHGPSGRHRRQ